MSELIPRATIRAHAHGAADGGKGPEACPYAAGTDAEYAWKDAFYIRVAQLSTTRMIAPARAADLDAAQAGA